jgi:hypothetical protein
MSASDELSKLSDRAALAEKNVEAAKGKGRAALKAQADAARRSPLHRRPASNKTPRRLVPTRRQRPPGSRQGRLTRGLT